MRNYVMSFGIHKTLHYFKSGSDESAINRATWEGAEYCIRLKGDGGPSLYTVLSKGWDE